MTNDASNQQLDRETICANCNVRLYQTADPNNIHWYHEGTGHVRCSTRFATPRSRVSDGGEVQQQPRDLIGSAILNLLNSFHGSGHGGVDVMVSARLRSCEKCNVLATALDRTLVVLTAATTDAKQEDNDPSA